MIAALLFAAAVGNFVPPSLTPEQERQVQQSARAATGQSAAAVIDARVDPKGKVSDCKAVVTSGDAQVAASICTHLNGMQIQPASVGGESSYGIVRGVVSLSPSGSSLAIPADLALQVNKLPAGQATLRVTANVLLDAGGKPQACYAAGQAPQAYADVACNSVSGLGFGTIDNDSGKPVPYVRSVVVDFELASTAQAAQPGG